MLYILLLHRGPGRSILPIHSKEMTVEVRQRCLHLSKVSLSSISSVVAPWEPSPPSVDHTLGGLEYVFAFTMHICICFEKKLATWKAINNLVLLYFHYLFIHRILPHCQPQDAWHTLKTLLLSPLSNQAAVCNNQLLLSSINCFNNAKTLCTLWTACLGMRVDTNLNVFRKPVFALPVWVTIHKKDCSCTMFALYCVTIQNKNLCACPALHTTALPDLA